MATLCVARLLVATMPFKWWRRSIGGTAGRRRLQPLAIDAERLAAHVDWAAKLLPFTTKCLPRAMALSWMLRPRGVAHSVVFAVRPAGLRGEDDHLHAWVEWS